MFNSAKFTLRQVELEFDKVQERHHNKLKLDKESYQDSAEMKANIAVMDALGVATESLREIYDEYNKSL